MATTCTGQPLDNSLVDVLRKEPKMLVRLEVMRLTMGDITEIAGKKKSHVLLWSS
jgi:hypothetical protein